ncbi:hypothetical protein EMIT0194MI4_10628 [Pseudomonas sp. IT-194MI4]
MLVLLLANGYFWLLLPFMEGDYWPVVAFQPRKVGYRLTSVAPQVLTAKRKPVVRTF